MPMAGGKELWGESAIEELEESSAVSDGVNSTEPTTLRVHRNLSVGTKKVSLTSNADT